MSKKTRQSFSFDKLKKAEFWAVISAVLFVLLIAVGSMVSGTEKLLNELEKLNVSTILIVFLVPLVGTVLRGLRWHVFAERLKFNVPPLKMLLYYFAGISMLITPGKVGTALRLWLLNKCHKIPYKKGLPLMIMDPVVDLASLFLLCMLGISGFAGELPAIITFGSILGAIILCFAKPILLTKLVKFIYFIFGKKKPRGFAMLLKIVKNITKLVHGKVLTKTIILSLSAWLLTIFAFYYLLLQLQSGSQSWEALSFFTVAFIFSFSIILGGATMAPGGLGGTEASMLALLLAHSVPLESAIASVAIIRIGTLWFGVLVGFAALPFALKEAKKAKQ